MSFQEKIFVGTCGWSYDWNPNGFEWYVKNSKLNAIELNASFYRFPFPNQVKGWLRRTKNSSIRWSVKINRLITHIYLLSDRAIRTWRKFRRLFYPLEDFIDFFLLQLPPRFIPSEGYVKRLERFIEEVNLGYKLAIEWRNKRWFDEVWIEWAKEREVTIVSIDSPLSLFYTRSGPFVYLRVHGRTSWYAYRYSNEELVEIARNLMSLKGERVYVFFNNDHDMLDNAREMLSIMRELWSS